MRTSPRKFLTGVVICGVLMLANLLTVRKSEPKESELQSRPYRKTIFPRAFLETDEIDEFDVDEDLEEMFNFDESTIDMINDLAAEDDPLMVEDVPPEEYEEAGKDHFRNPNRNFEGEEDRFEVAEDAQLDVPEIPKVHWVRPIPEADRDHWRAVRTGNDSVYVFSAFYDPTYQDDPIIRIVAIGRRDSTEKEVVCHHNYKFKAGSRTARTIGEVIVVKGQNSKSEYVSKWIHCPLPEDRVDIPDRIRIVIPYFKEHFLQVHYKKQKKSEEMGINVCVSPLRNSLGNTTRLIEFIELHKVMGAMHFTFYKQSLVDVMTKLLVNYKKEGFVTIFEHDLPEDLDVEDAAGPALAQDCFLRSRGVFQFVMILDLHEFIVPRKQDTIRGLMREMDMSVSSGMIFRTHVYCLESPSNRTIEKFLHVMKRAFSIRSRGPFQLMTMLKVFRTGYCDKSSHDRVLVKPWNVDEVQKNDITSSKLGFAPIEIPTFIAMNRRYDSCPDGSVSHLGSDCHTLKEPRLDLYQHNYLQRISKRVLHRMQKINKAVIRKVTIHDD